MPLCVWKSSTFPKSCPVSLHPIVFKCAGGNFPDVCGYICVQIECFGPDDVNHSSVTWLEDDDNGNSDENESIIWWLCVLAIILDLSIWIAIGEKARLPNECMPIMKVVKGRPNWTIRCGSTSQYTGINSIMIVINMYAVCSLLTISHIKHADHNRI